MEGSSIGSIFVGKPYKAKGRELTAKRNSASVCGHPVLRRPPLLFSTLKRLAQAHVRGSFRLLHLISAGAVVEYDLGLETKFTVPIFREDTCFALDEILSYEGYLMREMARRANMMAAVSLVDCGADIGIFSVLLCRAASTIESVIAIEANIEVLPFLKRNIEALPAAALIVGCAAGRSSGIGRLQDSALDHSEHARYLVNDSRGDILVTTVDSFDIRGDLILKIDVEGGEDAVLEGAARTIRQAPKCLICFEAHSEVTRRTGRDPLELLLFLNELRKFEFLVTTRTGTQAVSLDQKMFDPSDQEKKIWNIIAFSSSQVPTPV